MEHEHKFQFIRLDSIGSWDTLVHNGFIESGYYSVWVCECGQMKKVKLKEKIIFE